MPRFYLVDDEIWALADLEALLRQFPLVDKTCTFLDARKALSAILSDPPDAIFTDLRMDRMNGRTLISEVRNAGLNIPIVIISAYSNFEVAREALSFGVFDYLLKPVSRDSLQKTMERLELHLRGQGAQPSPQAVRREVASAYPECRVLCFPTGSEEARKQIEAACTGACLLRFSPHTAHGLSFAYLSNPTGRLPEGAALLTAPVGLSRPQDDFSDEKTMRSEAEAAAICDFRYAEHRRVSEIQSYLALSYDQPIKLEELAARFYMNKTYLCDIFRKECGVTVVSFLRDVRMAQAALLLKNTADPVQQIAARVGYPDSAYFTRIFRSLYGTSPETYRKTVVEHK